MITYLNSDFRPVIRYGIVIPHYYCNNRGDIWSAKTNRFLKAKQKYSARLKKEGLRLRSLSYNLSIPKGHFPDYDHRANGRAKAPAISIEAHRIVMETWKPVDEFPPKELKECWKILPEIAKYYIKKGLVVDHIDDDPSNNHVDNLRWVLAIENQAERKKVEMRNSGIKRLVE